MADEHENTVRRRRDLDAALGRLARRLDVPEPPDYASRVRDRLASRSPGAPAASGRRTFGLAGPWRRVATATIVLLLAMIVVLSVPATREAVADLFGFSGLKVRTLPSATASPRTTVETRADLGDPVTLDEARQRVSFPVSVPTAPGLGPPDAVYVRNGLGLESVSLVYRPDTGFPATDDPTVSLLVSEYSGTAEPFFEKLINEGARVTQVMVDGRWPGLYFPSPHQVLVRAPDGLVHEERPRLAAPTLVWVRDDVTYRLEADVDLEQALAVAASMPLNEPR